MKNILTNTTKTAYKGLVFWAFFWLTVFSVAYAASISSTTDTVSSWDSITANWYQDVNNKLGGISVSGGNVGIWRSPVDSSSFSRLLDIEWPSGAATYYRKTWDIWHFVVWQGSSNQTYLWNEGNGPMRFATNNSEKLRITEDGNVWIWTTAPGARLDLSQNANLSSSYLELSDSNNTAVWNKQLIYSNMKDYSTGWNYRPWAFGYIKSWANATSNRKADYVVYLADNDNVDLSYDEKFRITNNGNVWIWTVSPFTLFWEWNTLHISWATGWWLRLEETNNAVKSDLYSEIWGLTMRTITSHPIKIATNNSEKMRITETGNVWIWETNPVAKLDVKSTWEGATLKLSRNLDWWRVKFQYAWNDGALWEIGQTYYWLWKTRIWMWANLDSFGSSHQNPIQGNNSGPSWLSQWNSRDDEYSVWRIAPWWTWVSKYLNISANGNVGIWNTTPQNTFHVKPTGAWGWITVWGTAIWDLHLALGNDNIQASSLGVWYTPLKLNPLWWQVQVWSDSVADANRALYAKWYGYAALNMYRYADDGNTINFHRNGTHVWSVYVNGSTTHYNSNSDYRLKENITSMSDAITRVKALNPVRYNFKTTPNTTVDWFIAHEVQDVIPEAVSGEKDWVDAEGNPEYQSMDYSKVTPLLTAALQEALEKIEKLEERIKVLENK